MTGDGEQEPAPEAESELADLRPSRYAPHPNAAWRAIDDHIFIITPDNRQHELDGEVEAVVWHACNQQPRTIAELARAVVETFEVDGEVAEADLTEFVSALVEAGVLVEVPPAGT